MRFRTKILRAVVILLHRIYEETSIHIFLGLPLVLSVITPICGQKAWEKKSYEQWTLREVFRILLDSPWAQTAFDTFYMQRDLPGITYATTVRLHSGLPIRQALVRRMQLTIPYSELTSEGRAKYDSEVEGLLNCPQCLKYYIVSLNSHGPGVIDRSMSPLTGEVRENFAIDLIGLLKKVPPEELRKRVLLSNDRGERRKAAGLMTTERNEFVFIFARVDEHGQPLITPSNKRFYFEIEREVFKGQAGALRKFKFDVSRLVKNGEVAF